MAHPNGELLRNLYAAFDKADLETIQASIADDASLHVAGRGSMSGDFKGRDEVLGYLGEVVSRSGGTFKIEVHDVLATDDHVAVLSNVRAERDGNKLETQGVEIFHVSDGKITEAWFTGMDTYALDEFWG